MTTLNQIFAITILLVAVSACGDEDKSEESFFVPGQGDANSLLNDADTDSDAGLTQIDATIDVPEPCVPSISQIEVGTLLNSPSDDINVTIIDIDFLNDDVLVTYSVRSPGAASATLYGRRFSTTGQALGEAVTFMAEGFIGQGQVSTSGPTVLIAASSNERAKLAEYNQNLEPIAGFQQLHPNYFRDNQVYGYKPHVSTLGDIATVAWLDFRLEDRRAGQNYPVYTIKLRTRNGDESWSDTVTLSPAEGPLANLASGRELAVENGAAAYSTTLSNKHYLGFSPVGLDGNLRPEAPIIFGRAGSDPEYNTLTAFNRGSTQALAWLEDNTLKYLPEAGEYRQGIVVAEAVEFAKLLGDDAHAHLIWGQRDEQGLSWHSKNIQNGETTQHTLTIESGQLVAGGMRWSAGGQVDILSAHNLNPERASIELWSTTICTQQ